MEQRGPRGAPTRAGGARRPRGRPALGALGPGAPLPRPGAAARPPEARRGCQPPAAGSSPPSAPVPRSHGAGRGAGHEGCRRTSQVFLPRRERPSDQARFAAGTAGPGGSHGLGSRLPPPEPPDPSVAPSGGAGTRDRRRAAGGGGSCGARRGGGVCRAPPGGDLGAIILKNKGSRGRLGAPRAGPELELVLDTLSRRWRGSPSGLGRGAPSSAGPREGPPVRPRLPGAPGLWGPRGPWSGCARGRRACAPSPHSRPALGPGLRGAGRILFTSRRRPLFSR